ncbi:class I SAM-dependent methyltransferase [Spirochaeta isovalerica]|uniref:SAM-dependent methyltransferase n=1 Tax=Spirochaeta isovalerica TaxID=150 RepID=A0A841R6Q7_9SPIO|nr:class I SAM-dependent methyltransferase [Spirochaeta isovalerica]MBB6478458.1 SAM-dependent methyltransferase [Spirochaeta isovalerica]
MNKKWYYDDEFWITYGPVMFDRERNRSASYEIDNLIMLADLKPGDAVLDSCCGQGRHSCILADRGMKVTGVDITRPYLKTAEEKRDQLNLDIEFLHQDILDFRRESAYRAAFNLYNSLGYFEDPDDDMIYFKNVYDSLMEGGKFIIECTGKEVLAKDFRDCFWYEYDDFKIMVEYAINLNWTELETRWIFLKDGNETDATFRHRIFSAMELAGLLSGAGFKTIEFFGDYDGIPYDQNAQRLIAIAEK